MNKKYDLTGKRFGKLTVIGESPNKKWGQRLWVCKCDCGNTVEVCGGNLKSGHTNSCGCINLERIKCLSKHKHNVYIEHEDYLEGQDDKGNSFFIDKEDYNKICKYYWYKTQEGYWATSYVVNGKTKTIKLHQIVCPEADGKLMVPDHLDRNPSNNRKNNLAVKSRRDNSLNSGLQTNNKSGIIGVSWSKTENKWRASINISNGKQRIIGRYDFKIDAIIARLKAEKEYYGDSAPQKSLFKEYGIE